MAVLQIAPMEFQLHVLNPFVIAFHHRDLFPKGDGKMAPVAIPREKSLGEDFNPEADWRMYYGRTVPGFPVHPHRGFETVTVMIEGFADHFDSKGSKGRYGEGDVQWMTAGAGVQHSEMFPLLNDEEENPMELFQIWLNLPKKNKFAKPDYKMFWSEDIPRVVEHDMENRRTEVKLIAGEFKGIRSLDPLPASWAYNRKNKVGIWLIKMEPHAVFTLPALSSTLNRVLYNYNGAGMKVAQHPLPNRYYAELKGSEEVMIVNGESPSELLLLEGEPINEPIAARGPFVMNTFDELQQAFVDYRQTQFGGWQWQGDDPVNEKESPRFASYEGGKRVEYPRES